MTTVEPPEPELVDGRCNAVMAERLLTPAEVAKMFRVDVHTVTQWAKSGKLRSIRTPLGGHHRFFASEINELLKLETEGR